MKFILVYLVVPILLSGLIWFKRQPSIFTWLINSLFFVLVISFITITARWEIVGIYSKYIVLFILILSLIYGFIKNYKDSTSVLTKATKVSIAVIIVISVVMIVMNFLALRGLRQPDNPINLASPFKSGTHIVINGGGSPQINAHAKIEPQSFALDMVGVNQLGFRIKSVFGGIELENYEVFEDSIFSPINGVIVGVVDSLTDNLPPEKDIQNIAGNYLIVKFENMELVLAHFKYKSIVVKKDQVVKVGTYLGMVGNTGNSSEPHLHMHIESGGQEYTILNGKSVPFIIDGQYLVRGSLIKKILFFVFLSCSKK